MTDVRENQLAHLIASSGNCRLDLGASPFAWRAVLPISAPSSLTSPRFARGTAGNMAAEQASTSRHR